MRFLEDLRYLQKSSPIDVCAEIRSTTHKPRLPMTGAKILTRTQNLKTLEWPKHPVQLLLKRNKLFVSRPQQRQLSTGLHRSHKDRKVGPNPRAQTALIMMMAKGMDMFSHELSDEVRYDFGVGEKGNQEGVS